MAKAKKVKVPEGLTDRQAKRYTYLVKRGDQKQANKAAKAWAAKNKEAATPAPDAQVPTSENFDPYTHRDQQYEGLGESENTLANQIARGNISLGNMMQGDVMNQMQNNIANGPDFSGIPQLAGYEDFADYRKQYEDSVYNNYMSRAEEEFEQRRQDTQQMLANRGIPVGSELFNQQMNNLEREIEGEKQNIRTQAMTGSLGEAQFGAALSSEANQLGYNRALDAWGRPMQTYGMLQGMQDPSMLQAQYGNQMEKDLITANTKAQKQLAKQQHGFNLEQIRAGSGGGGGGGGGTDPYAMARFQHELGLERLAFQNALSQGQNNGKQPPAWAPVAGAAVGGLASGIGQGIGSYLAS